jgi:Spy/CpxP family protein refolding chaperone
MRKTHFVVSLLVLALLTGGVVIARDNAAKPEPSDKSADKTEKTEKSTGRKRGLVKPWSMLASLTDEQKDQIIEIHLKAVEEKKAIEEKEEEDIMALLNDEQKAELQAMQDKAKADSKAKRAEKKAKDADTTDEGRK